MYGLADCNNFYASCERMFAPDLNGRPVVVLSNNDGCIIARSDEAKALGLKMGDAYFQQAAFLRQNNVAVFSSNLELYGDMSTRVMNTLKSYSPATEVYSNLETTASVNLCLFRPRSARFFWRPIPVRR